jgi:hypothetical protein
MTTLSTPRLGDATFLEILEDLHWEGAPASWNYIDVRWKFLTQKPSHYNLREMARAAFSLAAHAKGLSFEQLKIQLRETHIEKNAGYAGADQPDPWANFRMSRVFGILPFDGVLVRMSDKYIRTLNLRRSSANEKVGESIFDSLIDLGSYALIGDCLLIEAEKTT